MMFTPEIASGTTNDLTTYDLPCKIHRRGDLSTLLLATAIFARTDVLGFERLEYDLTADAIELGLNAALPAVFELRCTIAEFGRGERI